MKINKSWKSMSVLQYDHHEMLIWLLPGWIVFWLKEMGGVGKFDVDVLLGPHPLLWVVCSLGHDAKWLPK